MQHKIKYKLQIISTVALAAALLSPAAKSQTPEQNIINQQDWITRQQQNKIEENQRLREEETIQKERARKKKEEEKQKEKLPISGKPQECFPIKTITLVDANSVSKRQQKGC